jgi:hypothetical protein
MWKAWLYMNGLNGDTNRKHSISTSFSTTVFACTVKNAALLNTAVRHGLLVLTLVGSYGV